MVATNGETEGRNINKKFFEINGRNILSAQTLEVHLLGVGTVLRSTKMRGKWPND